MENRPVRDNRCTRPEGVYVKRRSQLEEKIYKGAVVF